MGEYKSETTTVRRDALTSEFSQVSATRNRDNSAEDILGVPEIRTKPFAGTFEIFVDVILNFTVPLLKTLYDETKSLILLRRLSKISAFDDSIDSTTSTTPDEEKSVGKMVGAGLGAIAGLLALIPSKASLWLGNPFMMRFPEDLFSTGSASYGDALLGLLFLAATTIIGRTVLSVSFYVRTADSDYSKEALLGLVDGVLGPKVANTLREYFDNHAYNRKLIDFDSNQVLRDDDSSDNGREVIRRNFLLAHEPLRPPHPSMMDSLQGDGRSRNNSGENDLADPNLAVLDSKDLAFLRKYEAGKCDSQKFFATKRGYPQEESQSDEDSSQDENQLYDSTLASLRFTFNDGEK